MHTHMQRHESKKGWEEEGDSRNMRKRRVYVHKNVITKPTITLMHAGKSYKKKLVLGGGRQSACPQGGVKVAEVRF